ncbi:hypothetical protein AAVH_30702, partial [Aphelenchoides avenae]
MNPSSVSALLEELKCIACNELQSSVVTLPACGHVLCYGCHLLLIDAAPPNHPWRAT